MASIEKRGKGYRISVSLGRNIDGKQIIEKTTFVPDQFMTPKQQEKALEVFAVEFEQKVKSGKYYNGEKMSLKNFTEKWLEEYAKEQLEATSYASYEMYLRHNILPALGHLPIGKITPIHLNDFYNQMLKDGARLDGKNGGYSAGSIKKMHVALSSIFSTAVNWQLVDTNPCMKVKPPKLTRNNSDIEYFTLEQVKIFLNALDKEYANSYAEHKRKVGKDNTIEIQAYTEVRKIPTQFKVFFHIALFGGLRKGEVLGLTWDDINFEDHTIHINKSISYANREVKVKRPKTKSSIRKLVLPEFVINIIKE